MTVKLSIEEAINIYGQETVSLALNIGEERFNRIEARLLASLRKAAETLERAGVSIGAEE